MAHFVDPGSSFSQGLNGAEGGAFTSRPVRKNFITLSEIFDSCRLSVNLG